MMNDEEYIREKMGTHNPFTVPEGYFDRLAEEVIGKLPAETPTADSQTDRRGGAGGRKTALLRHLRPLLYAAASALLVVAVATLMRHTTADSKQLMAHQQETAATAYSDTYMEDMADYAMLDNEDIYASLLADI